MSLRKEKKMKMDRKGQFFSQLKKIKQVKSVRK